MKGFRKRYFHSGKAKQKFACASSCFILHFCLDFEKFLINAKQCVSKNDIQFILTTDYYWCLRLFMIRVVFFLNDTRHFFFKFPWKRHLKYPIIMLIGEIVDFIFFYSLLATKFSSFISLASLFFSFGIETSFILIFKTISGLIKYTTINHYIW